MTAFADKLVTARARGVQDGAASPLCAMHSCRVGDKVPKQRVWLLSPKLVEQIKRPGGSCRIAH